MKKYLSLILIVSFLFSLVSCRKMPDSHSGSDEISVIEEIMYSGEEKQSTQQEISSDSKPDDASEAEKIVFDADQKDWKSTVIAPTTVIFYKDGMQSVSTDKELNHKIARHIEEWYKGERYGMTCACYSDESYVTYLKHKETAIQLEFDAEVKMYGGFIPSSVRRIFIPLTGEDDYVIFATGKGPGYWSHFYVDGSGLEQYFEERTFETIPEWQSTVSSPMKIQLYQNGNLLGEYTDADFNYKVAQHIESWYIYKESIKQTTDGMTADTITNIRNNDTYIELFFVSEIKFYGKNMILPETYNLLIPLTGDYAYCIFEAGDDYNYNKFSFSENSRGLEQFFEMLNIVDNS